MQIWNFVKVYTILYKEFRKYFELICILIFIYILIFGCFVFVLL